MAARKTKTKPAKPRGGAPVIPDDPDDIPLTFKQRLFVEAYLGVANGNATEAARRAGYGSPSVAGCNQLKNVNVKSMIAARVGEAAMPANEVLARLAEQAAAGMGDFLDIAEDGSFKLSLAKAKKLGLIGVVKKLKPTQFGYQVELYDKFAALKLLASYHGLLRSDGSDDRDGESAELDARFAAAIRRQMLVDKGGPADGD